MSLSGCGMELQCRKMYRLSSIARTFGLKNKDFFSHKRHPKASYSKATQRYLRGVLPYTCAYLAPKSNAGPTPQLRRL